MSIAKKITPYLFRTSIGAGVIADHWFGVSEAGNLSIAVVFVIFVATVLVCAFSKKESLVTKESKNTVFIYRVMTGANVIILIAAGWFATAFALATAWILSYLKTYDGKKKGDDA